MTTTIGIRLLLVLAIAATVSCHRATKHIAAATLAGVPSQSFLADTVRLQYVENTGGFLSLGEVILERNGRGHPPGPPNHV